MLFRFVCKICSKFLTSQAFGMRHVIMKHNIEAEELEINFEKYLQHLDKSEALYQIQNEKLQCNFKCKICCKLLTSQTFGMKHLIMKHNIEAEELEVNFDDYLEQIDKKKAEDKLEATKSKIQLNKALVRKKKKEWGFRCKICSKLSSSQRFGKKHVIMRHDVETEELEINFEKYLEQVEKDEAFERLKEKKQKVSCKYCNEIYTGFNSMDQHIKTVHFGRLRYNCRFCNVRFKTNKQLIIHKEDEHGIKANFLVCEYCSFKTDKPAELKCHILNVHKKIKNYVCDTCGHGVRTPYLLEIHQRRHTKKKPYRCKICEKDYRCSTIARQHLRKIHDISVPIYSNKYVCEADKYILRTDEVGSKQKLPRVLDIKQNFEEIEIKTECF